MSCQGDDSTEETPPGAGHLGASHAKFKSSVSWLGGLKGAKQEQMFIARAGKGGAVALLKSAHPGRMGPEQHPSTSLAPKASPAGFCRFKFHFKAVTFEGFSTMRGNLIFYMNCKTQSKAHLYGLQENNDHCSQYKLTS